MEPETEAQPEEREEEEEEEEQEAPEEEEAQVEEPPPKPKRVRPSRAKVVVEVKKIGRPKTPPGAPKAKYTARKIPAPEPVFQSDQPPPERLVGLVPSQMAPGDVVAMTRFMAEQIGSLQKTSFDTKREGWRNLIAGTYE